MDLQSCDYYTYYKKYQVQYQVPGGSITKVCTGWGSVLSDGVRPSNSMHTNHHITRKIEDDDDAQRTTNVLEQ